MPVWLHMSSRTGTYAKQMHQVSNEGGMPPGLTESCRVGVICAWFLEMNICRGAPIELELSNGLHDCNIQRLCPRPSRFRRRAHRVREEVDGRPVRNAVGDALPFSHRPGSEGPEINLLRADEKFSAIGTRWLSCQTPVYLMMGRLCIQCAAPPNMDWPRKWTAATSQRRCR